MHARCLGAEQIPHARQVFARSIPREYIMVCVKSTCALFRRGQPRNYCLWRGVNTQERGAKGAKSEFTPPKQTKTYGYWIFGHAWGERYEFRALRKFFFTFVWKSLTGMNFNNLQNLITSLMNFKCVFQPLSWSAGQIFQHHQSFRTRKSISFAFLPPALNINKINTNLTSTGRSAEQLSHSLAAFYQDDTG